jgi:uncharacterized repeat protein (TIGR02543 family)
MLNAYRYVRNIRICRIGLLVFATLSFFVVVSCGGGSGGGDSSYLPAKPTSLEVTDCNENSVSIQWTDNADNESGYVIERSVNGGEFTEIKKVGPDEKEYVENLPDDTFHMYRVYAYNDVGNSAYSNDAPAKRSKATQTEIGISTGGTVALGNLAKVTFPANSFDGDETITTVEGINGESVADDKRPYLDVVSDIRFISIIDFTEKDLELKKSVKLVMYYNPDEITQFNDNIQLKNNDLITQGAVTQADVDKMKISVSEMDIYYFNTISSKWVKTNAVLDTNAKTFTLDTACLGVYCIGYSMVARRGVSIEADPDLQQHIIDVFNSDDENTDSNSQEFSGRSCSSCGIDSGSKSASITRVYSGYTNCKRCPKKMIIDGVEVTKLPNIYNMGKEAGLGCDNCSSAGQITDQASGYAFTWACSGHDCCYSHGYATYGYYKTNCDLNFLGEMIASCWKKYPLWGHRHLWFITIYYPIPQNYILLPNCLYWADITYYAIATPATGFCVVAYDLQPCFDYYKTAIDCHIPVLRNIKSSVNRCEAAETIAFTPSVYNEEKRPLTYLWTATAGSIDNPTAENITWTAPPSVAIDTNVTVTLKISDGSNNIPAKSKTIKVLKNYTIAYAANGASSGTVPASTYHNYYGDVVAVPGNTGSLVLAGYNFTGWNTRADGLGLDRPGGCFFIMGTSDLTLSAKWSQYPMVYNGNGNTGGAAPVDAINYMPGDSVTVLPNSGLVKNSDTFLCWNTAVDGSGTNYNPGDTFTLGMGNLILYARWSWTRLLGAAGANTRGQGISVDGSGNSYVTGCTTGNLDDQTLTGFYDLVVAKYNISGVRQWTRLLGVAGKSTFGTGISVDVLGNSYVTGYTDGNLDGQTHAGSQDVFVIKYDASGVRQWTRLLGVSGKSTIGNGISGDGAGNSYVTGNTQGNLDGQTLTGISDVFITKYDTSGLRQWTRLLGVAGKNTNGTGISVDGSGNIYVAGYTNGNLDGQTLSGIEDLFVTKYNTSGVRQWTRLLGVAGKGTDGAGISVDGSGNSYAAGTTGGNLDGQILTGYVDLFVTKYDTSGVSQWTRLLGSVGNSIEYVGISVDGSGNSYSIGLTFKNLDGQILTNSPDYFITKYNTSGVRQWTRLPGVLSPTMCSGITVDSFGYNHIVGSTGGNLDGQILPGNQSLFITTKYNLK